MTEHGILGFDPLAGTWPLWAAGVAAALFVAVGVIAFRRSATTGIFPTALRYSVILVGALVVLTFFDRATMRDRQAERRALEARSTELTARAVMPGSTLACLDSGAGDEVEHACEKALFANPETVAAAVSYVAARFALLGEGLDYAAHDSAYAATLNGTRRALEADRFGILAHVLATRDGCVADRCPALKRLGDASRVQRNLRERTYAAQVARYVPTWTGRPAASPVASLDAAPSVSAPGSAAPTATVPGAVAPVASSVPNIDFPSASSIPPVSIMNAEPGPSTPASGAPATPAATAPAAAPKPAIAAAPPPRRPPAPARRAAPAAEPGVPVQITPVTPTPFDNVGQPAAAAQ
jgi:hypothetical protein